MQDRFYRLEPDVPGGLGRRSEFEAGSRPLRVSRFHYDLNVWPDDHLFEAVSNYVATDTLKSRLIEREFTGVEYGSVDVTMTPELADGYPQRRLPDFVWLKIVGRPGVDDFGLDERGVLVVSSRALAMLRDTGISNCDVFPFEG